MAIEPYKILGIKPESSVEQIKTAYRALARKWHPDRFPDGPERIWAEDKMIKLNQAYEEALRRCVTVRPPEMSGSTAATGAAQVPDETLYSDVRSLMGLGQLDHARRTLMRSDDRGPEWNYLFGAILMRRGDYDKASVYFGVSSRMMPDCAQYRAALRSAEALRDRSRKTSWQHGIANFVNSLRKNRQATRSFVTK